MKKIYLLACTALLASAASAQTKSKAPLKKTVSSKTATSAVNTLKTNLDSASYGFGVAMGTSLKQGGLKGLNYTALVEALKATFAGSPAKLNEMQAQEAIKHAFDAASKSKFAGNIKEGADYLAANKAKAGVKTTSTGLQYQVLTLGTGAKPAATDTVLVHYKGTLINGKQFDSSYDRNEPISFPLGNVIKGWTEGVQLMPEGSKYRFTIPYQLAYGERGAGQDIPPYSTLIFDVELLKVTPKK